jgi:hypothetical protein
LAAFSSAPALKEKMDHAKIPCVSCPWRRDIPIGKFEPDRFRRLASCAYDMARLVFACHMSKEGAEFACAGFLLQSAGHNLSVRLARQDFSMVRSPWPLYGTYREMAVANGVGRDDPSLGNCRDDSAGDWPADPAAIVAAGCHIHEQYENRCGLVAGYIVTASHTY